MMGVGYWLTEKLQYDGQSGKLITDRTWTYKGYYFNIVFDNNYRINYIFY